MQIRRIELEEQLLDIQQKRLELEQRRIELVLKRMKLPTKKSKCSNSTTSNSSSMPAILIRNCSMYGKSDDDESTAKTVSTQQDFSDGGNQSTSRLSYSGGESEGEEAGYISVVETNTRISEPWLAKFEDSPVSSSPVTEDKTSKKERTSRSVSETHLSDNAPADDKFQTSSREGHSMRDLVSSRPSLGEVPAERSSSLRELFATTHRRADAVNNDICNQSTETFETAATKVTSNVSRNAKLPNREASYPKLTEDRSSYHSSCRNPSTSFVQDGEFAYTWPDGRHYDGYWKDGKFHGLGVHTWPNGGKYVGQYKFGLKHGYGVYIWADGSKYEGQFAHGKRHGKGVQMSANGTIYHDGIWKDDAPIRTPAATA